MNKDKKLLYLITKGNFGGAQRYVYDLARYMTSDFSVTVATGNEGILNDKLNRLKIHNVVINKLKRDVSLADDLGSIFAVLDLIKKQKPQILHTNSSKAGLVGAVSGRIYNLFFAKKENKLKIIFTSHGWAFNEKRSIWQKIVFYFLHGITMLLSSKTIAVSNASKEDNLFPYFIKNKIKVIHNGIENTHHLPMQKSREKLSIQTNHKIFIGTISELHKNKGIDIAIKGLSAILKENPEIGFYIIGAGEEEKELEKLITKLDLKEQVVFLGFVEDANEYLKAFDFFLLSSRTENLPYVLLETGDATVPVIATNVGGVKEVIENLKTGLVIVPNSPDEIKNSVRYALSHRDEMSVFARNLNENIHKNFSVREMVRKTKEVYFS